jgi:uncharacterized protein YggE
VDTWAEVQYDGVEFEYADKEAQKQNAIARACDNAAERKKIYEEKFELKLTPVRFGEGEVGQRNATPANEAVARSKEYSGGWSSAAPAAGESVSSFGELVYTARVTVEYSVQPK